MSVNRIVVVGASAGGVESLQALVSSLPSDFAAAVFIVLHIPPNFVSHLPEILSRNSPFPVRHPAGREKIKAGHIFVAPPDHHLLIEEDCVIATRGPKENRNRPSIDALFRSAAYHYREKVIGIVLSGALDDGTSGLWNIKRMGGVTITQEVSECVFDSMPLSALEQVAIDFSVSASQMGQLLAKLICEAQQVEQCNLPKAHSQLGLENDIAVGNSTLGKSIIEAGPPSVFTCPECHVVMMEIEEGRRIRYRCHTGHAYSVSALLSELIEGVDQSYWKAMRGLEEAAMLLEKAGMELEESNRGDAARLFRTEAEQARKQAKNIRETVLSGKCYSSDTLLGEAEKNTKK